jgi:Ser/Thr protein kinase RdoA (MazF antagonist)
VPAAEFAADRAATAALAEYDVGDPSALEPVPAGGRLARKVITASGAYLLKPAYRSADVVLEAEVARLLADRGIRQPAVIPTSRGAVVSTSGYVLREFLPGSTARSPTRTQVGAVMRHLAAVHLALGELQVDYQPDLSSPWVRVTSPHFLVTELPSLLADYGLGDDLTTLAVSYLNRSHHGLATLPRQLVHGDIGPDNVVMAGTEVVALIDFTPHLQPVLFAAATALYWYHVYGRARLRADPMLASLAAMAEVRPWNDTELALWPAALTWEALRRLATPLELAREHGGEPGHRVGARLRAVHAVARALVHVDAVDGAAPSARHWPGPRTPA